MINLDLINLSDCFTPAQLVNEIRSQCPDLSLPIPINDLAYASGIAAIEAMPSEDIEGILVADAAKETGVILYKKESPQGRQRFTIGHELGHFLLLHHGSEQSCLGKNIRIESGSNYLDEIEAEANLFSQLMLMPDDLISNFINSKTISMEVLKEVELLTQMSFEAIANRCASLSKTPFALIYSLNGVVRYCWRDWERFPYWIPFKGGDSMPRSSQAIMLKQEDETISISNEVNYLDWVNLKRNQSVPKSMLEQTYTQRDGYQVTMLRLNNA